MLDKVESLGKVHHSKNRPRTWLGFVKLIRNGQRKIKNLIESRPSREKNGLGKEKMQSDSRKKIGQDSMMQSKSFEMQEMR